MVWAGHYLDGQVANRVAVTASPSSDGLVLTREDGVAVVWLYADIRQTQGFHPGEQIRLERGRENPEVLLIDDQGILVEIAEVAPQFAKRFHDPRRRGTVVKLSLVAIPAILGVWALLYFVVLPGLSVFLARRVPVSWEEHLGQLVLSELAPEERRCTEPELQAAVEQVLGMLTQKLQDNPYRFRVFVADDATINAFAAPGGYIVVYRGLLQKMRTSNELAGVLAHEVQHVVKRHGTQALFQALSTRVILAGLAGDMEQVSSALQTAGMVGLLRFSREHEAESDREGMALLLASQLDPYGMVKAFETLQDEVPQVPAAIHYLSTHPQMDDRIAQLVAMAKSTAPRPPPISDTAWAALRDRCR